MRGPKRRKTSNNNFEPNTIDSVTSAVQTDPLSADSPLLHGHFDAAALTPTTFNIQSPQESLSGDASARGFLTRVYGHLGAAGHVMPRYLSRPADRDLPGNESDATIILPSRETTMSYLECFAEHAQVTYRYVPRQQWMSLVTRLHDDDESLLNDDTSMAVLLLVIGLGYDVRTSVFGCSMSDHISCVWYPSWKDKDFADYRVKA